MYQFKQKLAQFMYGRHGLDEMFGGLFLIYIILGFLRGLLGFRFLFTLLMDAVLFYAFFRVLSRNHEKRYQENQAFLKIWGPFQEWCKLCYHRFRDRKTKVYRTCPNCHKVIRLPRKKGKHDVTCPICRTSFKVKIH